MYFCTLLKYRLNFFIIGLHSQAPNPTPTPSPPSPSPPTFPVFLIIIYVLVGFMALIGAIGLIHTMVVFTAWLKERFQPIRLRFGFRNRPQHSPTENSPLRSQQPNFIPPSMDSELPSSSRLSHQSEVIAMTSFGATRLNSNRNSVITVEEELSENEETSFLPSSAASSSVGTRPKKRSKLVAVASPMVPEESEKDANQPSSLLTYVKTKYASFLQSRIEVKNSSSSDSEHSED